MAESPEKNEIYPKYFWQITAEVLISTAGVVFFAESLSGILSGVFGINFYTFRLAIILSCLILVPSAFAFPIVINRKKLLFIPACIMPLFIVICYFHSYPESILTFCIALAVIGSFGAVAGIMINSISSKKSKAKTIKISASGLILLTPVLIIWYVLAGSPLHSLPVNKTVKDYVSKNYSEYNVVVSRTWYDWYDGKYVTQIHEINNKDRYFEVWYSKNRGITDRFNYGNFRK